MGFVAAWAASVSVGFVSGCSYAARMDRGHVVDFIKAAVSGNRDALSVAFFVGAAVAVAAAVIALLTALFVAWPLYLTIGKRQQTSLRVYLLAGVFIALLVAGILLALQHLIHDFPAVEYWFEIATIILAGPIATLTFWTITRPSSSSCK
jgi:hypothetical protein